MHRINRIFKLTAASVAMSVSLPIFAQQQEVLKLEETIRANQEQPKVLTIVPWQSPKAKQALPSPIVERINKQFMPLQRSEMQRQLKILDLYPTAKVDT